MEMSSRKEKQVNQRIENMMQQKAQIASQQLRKTSITGINSIAKYSSCW